MKTVSTKDLRKMKSKGFNVSEVKKPEIKPEDPTVEAIRALETSLGIDRKALSESIKESLSITKKQTDAIVRIIGKETPKKEFVLIPERNSEGYIQKITIREI